MQLLIAHRNDASRLALKLVAAALPGGDIEVIESGEGAETLELLLAAESPIVAVVDWDLPGCDGPELCRLVRAYRHAGPPYIILLAQQDCRPADGLEAGADDCVRTPADAGELRARINVGRRFVELPWERVIQAETVEPHVVAQARMYAVPQLDAQRSADDDEPDESAARFELKSVLVAR